MLDETVVLARDIMTREVAVINAEAPLLDAVKLMAQHRISGLPVVDAAGKPVGIISEGDLVRWHEGLSDRQANWLDKLADGYALAPGFLQAVQDAGHKVKAVMSPGVTTVTEETSARDLASIMSTRNIKRLPVVRDGRLVGIVARSDLVRALARHLDKAPQPEVADPVAPTVDEALRRRRERPAG